MTHSVFHSFYSPSRGGFYPADHLDDYRNTPGGLPADLVGITKDHYDYLFDGQSRGKEIVSDSDGSPVLKDNIIDPSVLNAGEQAARVSEANSIIDVLSNERDAEIISDADLKRWKAWVVYRKVLRELDVSKDEVAWPAKPE